MFAPRPCQASPPVSEWWNWELLLWFRWGWCGWPVQGSTLSRCQPSRCHLCVCCPWCKYFSTPSPDQQPLSWFCKVAAQLLTEVRTKPGLKESALNMELIKVSLENPPSFKALFHLLLPNGFVDWIIFPGEWEGKIFTRLQNMILQIEKIIDSNSLGNTVWNSGIKNGEMR